MTWQVVETPTGRITARYPVWLLPALPLIRVAVRLGNRWNAEEGRTERYVLQRARPRL